MKESINQNLSFVDLLARGHEVFKGFSWSRNPDRVLIVLGLYIAAMILLNKLLF